MSTNIFNDYQQLMSKLGKQDQLKKEEARHQEIMGAIDAAIGTIDVPDASSATETLRSMLKSPKYSEDYENFPGEHAAAKWFHAHPAFAVRAADEALRRWSPSPESEHIPSVEYVRDGLLKEREWHASRAKHEIDKLGGRSAASRQRELMEGAIRLQAQSNRTLDWCTQGTQGREQIRRTTQHIEEIEAFLTRTSRDELDSEVYGMLQYALSALYYHRANSKAMVAQRGGSKDEDTLRSALRDAEKALSYPDSCFVAAGIDVHHRAVQRELKEKIEKDLKSSCFIATAAYGSALAPEVMKLRHFRDMRLKPSRLGRNIIRIYERFSPPLANWIARRPQVRVCVQRLILNPLLWLLRHYEHN